MSDSTTHDLVLLGSKLEVAAVCRETADAVSITFEVPSDLHAAFDHRAGQFITVAVPSERVHTWPAAIPFRARPDAVRRSRSSESKADTPPNGLPETRSRVSGFKCCHPVAVSPCPTPARCSACCSGQRHHPRHVDFAVDDGVGGWSSRPVLCQS